MVKASDLWNISKRNALKEFKEVFEYINNLIVAQASKGKLHVQVDIKDLDKDVLVMVLDTLQSEGYDSFFLVDNGIVITWCKEHKNTFILHLDYGTQEYKG